MLILLGILLIGILTFISTHRDIDILHPSVLFSVIILSSYFVACLHLSDLQSEYPIDFTLLILSLILAFIAGGKFSNLIKWNPKNVDVQYKSSVMQLVCFLLWSGILISFIVEVLVLGAPPAISMAIRSEYFLSLWGSIVILQSVFAGLLFYDRYNQNVVGKLFWVYALTIIIIDGLLANKYQIISLGLIFLIAYNSYKRRIRIKILFVGIGMIILLFLVLFEFVYQEMYGITIDMIYNIYQMNIPREFEILTQPYLYVAFNYDNLYNFLSNSHDSFYGLKTLNGFLSIVGIDQFYLSTQQLISSEWHSILTIESLTAGTMFEDPAQDGDIPFMILFTFLCGIWSSASYKKFIYNRGFFAFFMFASISCAIFMSFFYNAFTSKITLLNLLAAYCINIVLNKTSKARSI